MFGLKYTKFSASFTPSSSVSLFSCSVFGAIHMHFLHLPSFVLQVQVRQCGAHTHYFWIQLVFSMS